MPRIFKKKSLHLCFFNIKCLPTSFSPPLTLEDDEDDIIYTHNFLINDNIKNNTNNNLSSIMMKNYNSIYDLSIPSCSTTFTTNTSFSSASISTSTSTITDDYYDSHPPDFPTVFASRRFFVSSPGSSNSILDSSSSVSPSGKGGNKKIVGGGVPVKKNSSDPYGDFKRSIKDMIDARESEKLELGVENDGNACEWEFLQELLLCYLTLNPKNTHKLIVGAFSDVLVSMMSNDVENRMLPFVTEAGF